MSMVLITGASRGIGSEIARTFALNGYNVCINYNKSKDYALKLANELNNFNNDTHCIAIQADISDINSVKRMVDDINNNFGSIDILINNAAISEQKLFTDISVHDWKKMMSINLNGVYNCCSAVIENMISKKYGKIINIGSIWGEQGASMEVHYSTSKAALIGFTKSLAKELGPSGITVNLVSPGVIKTDMLNDFSDEELKDLADRSALNRIGTPKDVAEAVLFLASDKANFITATVLRVDGGFCI